MSHMRPYERAASIRTQLDRLLNNAAAPPDPVASMAVCQPELKPKKAPARASRPRAQAKNVIRAAKVVTSKSLAAPSARRSFSEGGPQFIHRTPELARHRRKCAVCHHPEREAIEDLFVHWHSPENIASHYEEDDESITWISVYRHAYALGLDEIRRRNLRFVFEHILDQAGTTAATPASIIVAARALGSCVGENGQWNEPPKRVLVTNIVRHDSPQAAPATQIENHANPENNVARVGADVLRRPASPAANGNPSSAAEANVLATEAASAVPRAFVGADSPCRTASPEIGDNSSSRARPDSSIGASHSPCPVHIRERGDIVGSDFRPASASSPEIRNSPNSFKPKEPLISNR